MKELIGMEVKVVAEVGLLPDLMKASVVHDVTTTNGIGEDSRFILIKPNTKPGTWSYGLVMGSVSQTTAEKVTVGTFPRFVPLAGGVGDVDPAHLKSAADMLREMADKLEELGQ